MERQLYDERELWKRITAGDADCFDEWYRDTAPRLRAFVRRILISDQAAEDVMQETFIQIWRRPKGFDPARGTLRAYLFGTARKLAASWNRKQKPTEAIKHEPPVPNCVEADSIIVDALDHLEPDQRIVLWLREVEGHSYSELSEILDIPIGTVRSRLYAARESLRAVWHEGFRTSGGPNELQ